MGKKKNIGKVEWELLVKLATNETGSKDREEAKSLLNKSQEIRTELETTQKMLGKIDDFYSLKNFDSHNAWKNVQSKIYPEKTKTVQLKNIRKEAIRKFYKYAAIVFVVLLLGSIGYYIGFVYQNPVHENQIVMAENQVLNEYVLPDGSVVTLNWNSQLEFPKNFNDSIREVTIRGEAFFDVKPNAKKPFVINAGNAQVKVLGTSFNVSAYPETETVEVVVKTGKVRVIRKKPDTQTAINEVILVPGEKGTLFNQSNLLEKSVNTNPNFVAWKTLDLIFDKVPLNEVILNLEKVYHADIQLMEPELNNLVYTGHFDQKPINFVLDVIRLTFNLNLSEENEQFVLSDRK
ncbi:FecR family protein [Maribellus maritimus]|uniref:FecR family protein n=1 Tax=Maribellus maritimus TaxID=2870838 RepID=UPI001EEB5DEA|nr:FecR domain-containing protein [Maribellus maritimus]MCG6190757.1 FecR domain-containing protein [Maribellus maritimus]